MDRFQPPTYRDEFYYCDCCGERKHYEEFEEDSSSVCKQCDNEENRKD